MIDNWMTMAAQAAVYFADKNALKGSLIDTLREVKNINFMDRQMDHISLYLFDIRIRK